MTWASERLDDLKAGRARLPPIVGTLALGTLDDWGEGWVRKSWSPTPELATADGTIFGGYLAALADQVLTFAAMTVVPDDCMFRTTNLQLNFVRVARADALRIEARVVAHTRQMITVRATFLRADDAIIAEASAQQLVMPLEGRPTEKAAVEAWRA